VEQDTELIKILVNSERKFADVEAACEKMLKDSTTFRDSVSSTLLPTLCILVSLILFAPALLVSGTSFAGSFATLFSPMGAEYNLAAKHPQAEATVKNISTYQTLMEEMRGLQVSCL